MEVLDQSHESAAELFVVMTDMYAHCLYTNTLFSTAFNPASGSLIGSSIYNTVTDTYRHTFENTIDQLMLNPDKAESRVTILHKTPKENNNTINIEWQLSLIAHDRILFVGKEIYPLIKEANLRSTFESTDVTSTKIAEGDLKESYDRMNRLINNTPLAIIEYDKDMKISKWNPQAEKIFGWKEDEVIGKKMKDLRIYEADRNYAEPVVEKLYAGSEQIVPDEYRNYTKDHKLIYCQWYNSILHDGNGNVTAYLSMVSDISNQKLAEEKLREREEQLRLFVKHSPAALAMFDTDIRYILYSRRWLSDYNLGDRDITGLSHYDVFPNLSQDWKEIHLRCLKGATEKNDEDTFVRTDGSIDWVQWEVHPWYKASGEVGGIIMFTEVITRQKEAEIKFRQLAEKSLVGVYIIQNGRYPYVNPKFAEIFGYTQDELIDLVSVEDVIMEDDREMVNENIKARIEGSTEGKSYELRGKKKDGQTVWVEVFGNRTQYKGNTAIIGTLLDISTRRRAEEEKERTRYLLNERIKELTVLYRAHHILQEENASLKHVLHQITSLLPSGWQYSDITAARIIFGDIVCTTTNYTAKSKHLQRADFQTTDGVSGSVEVIYLESKPAETEDAFLAEERNLINVVAEMLRIYLDRKHTTEALMKSEANLHTILETTDTAYILFDRDLKILSYNAKALSFVKKMLTGKPDPERSIFEYLLAEKKENLQKLIPEVLNGKTVSYESYYPQQDGSENWFHIRIYPVTNPDNFIFTLMMSISDITESKLTERTRMEHMKLLEELSFVTSHELRHEYAKVQSAINFLRDIKSSAKEQSMVIKEIAGSFAHINTLIYKLNDKITFNQGSINIKEATGDLGSIKHILLIDDDPMINFLNERILNAGLKESKKIINVTGVDDALEYLGKHDKNGDHLIFLDLNMPEKSGWDFLETYSHFKVQSPVMILTSSIDPNDMKRSKQYPQVKKFLTKPLSIKFVKTLFADKNI